MKKVDGDFMWGFIGFWGGENVCVPSLLKASSAMAATFELRDCFGIATPFGTVRKQSVECPQIVCGLFRKGWRFQSSLAAQKSQP